MTILDQFLIALGLSADAFAISLILGLAVYSGKIKKAVITGLYFGVFQAVMPVIGYFLAALFSGFIGIYDRWIAFALLFFIGIKMMYESFKKQNEEKTEASFSPLHMLPLALATSIDAMAVGASFVLTQISLVPAIFIIGITTFLLSGSGIILGGYVGVKIGAKANFAGGVILILIGFRILMTS